MRGNSNEYKLLFDRSNYDNGGMGYYWLASNCIQCNEDTAYFGTRYVSRRVDFIALQKGDEDIENDARGLGLRPVVYLKSDIKLEKDGDDVWQFVNS